MYNFNLINILINFYFGYEIIKPKVMICVDVYRQVTKQNLKILF